MSVELVCACVCVCVCVGGGVHALLLASDVYAPAPQHAGAWVRIGVEILCILD